MGIELYGKLGIFKRLRKLFGLSGSFCFLFFSIFHPLLHNHPLIIGPLWKAERHKDFIIKVNYFGEHKPHKFCPACHFLSLGKSFEHHFAWEVLLKITLTRSFLLHELIICQTVSLSFGNRSPPMC